MGEVYVLNRFKAIPYTGVVFDTTSQGPYPDLSPFNLGPVQTYEPSISAANLENLWQYCKVYPQHTYQPQDFTKWLDNMAWEPADSYYRWRDDGWRRQRADRYPMGKGVKPLYSLWRGTKLGYIDARKKIYAPLYAGLVLHAPTYRYIYDYYQKGHNIILLDYDAYDYVGMGMTLKDVANNPKRKMGHAFVIAMLLKNELHSSLRD